MRRVVRCSNCAPSCASSRETEALMLDFGRASALAAAVKPPCSITQQKASTSFQSIVRYSGQSIQRTQFILPYQGRTLVPHEENRCGPRNRRLSDELLVRRRLG